MKPRIPVFAGWLCALPGILISIALLVVATPVFRAIGCRTAGIMSITCTNDLVGVIAEFFWIVLLLSASFIPISAILILFTILFVGWRAHHALRRRQAFWHRR